MGSEHPAWRDFGTSLRSQTPIADDLRQKVPVTLELALHGAGPILAVDRHSSGCRPAVKQDSPTDLRCRQRCDRHAGDSRILAGNPGHYLAFHLVELVAAAALRVTLLDSPGKNLVHMALPARILGIGLSGGVMRSTPALMLEVMRQDYLRTAKAKGLRDGYVVLLACAAQQRNSNRHAAWPSSSGCHQRHGRAGDHLRHTGDGLLLLDAINNWDHPVVQAGRSHLCRPHHCDEPGGGFRGRMAPSQS